MQIHKIHTERASFFLWGFFPSCIARMCKTREFFFSSCKSTKFTHKGFLSFMYYLNMFIKAILPSRCVFTNSTLEGFLSFMYSQNVSDKVSFSSSCKSTKFTLKGLLSFMYYLNMSIKSRTYIFTILMSQFWDKRF